MNLKLQKLSKVSMAFLMALFSVSSYGQILLTEDFDYTIGDNLTNNGWTAHSGTTTQPIKVTSGLSFTGYAGSGIGGAANIAPGANSAQDLNKTFTPQSGTVYVSFMLRTQATNNEGYFLHLAGNPVGSTFFTRLFVNSTGSGLAISDGTFTGQYVPITAGNTYLIVMKRSTGGETSLFVFDTLPTAEPQTANMSYSGTTASIASIALRQYSSAQKQIVDGIRVATSWNDIFANTWNGSSWSNGTPTATQSVIINGAYTGTGFTAQSTTVNSGVTLTINSGEAVTTGNTTNNGNIIVNDGGNFIQTVGSTYTAVTGSSFVVNRNSASAVNKYVFWSSPVVDQNIFTSYSSGSSALAPTYVMTYNTTSNFYDLVTNTDSNFFANSGKGYSVKVPQANAGVLFGGTNKTPNNGIVNVALAGTVGGINYNLIGNPYPSNLDLNAFYTANNAAIESTLWFWDNTTGNVTTQTGSTATNVGYATVNLANPAGTTWVEAPGTQSPSYTTASLNTIGNVAKAGQGFIVKALGAGQASFTNAMRSSAIGVTLNKNGDANAGKFWIKLTTSYGNTATQAVTYSQGASDAYDVYDSKAMGMGSDAFYSLVGAEKLVIQGKSSFNINDVVPLGAKHFENGNFTVSLSHKEGLFTNGQAIYLHDKSTGTYTNLQNQTYTFAANAGEFANRFDIVYKLNVLATSEVQKDTFEVYRDGEDFFVRNNKNIENIEVFDATGRKIQSIDSTSKLVRVKLESTGVYIIKAKSAGKEYSKKVVK